MTSQQHAADVMTSQQHAADVMTPQQHAADVMTSQQHAADVMTSQQHAADVMTYHSNTLQIQGDPQKMPPTKMLITSTCVQRFTSYLVHINFSLWRNIPQSFLSVGQMVRR